MHTKRRKIKLSLALILVLVLLGIAAIAFRDWLLIGYDSTESTTLSAIKSVYQQYMSYLLGDNTSQNVAIRYAVPFILFFISISLISIIVLFVLLIIRRTQKLKQETLTNYQVRRMQDLIISYIFSPNPHLFLKLQFESKKMLVDQLVILHNNFIGHKATLTKQLFYELKLDDYVANRMKSWLWDVRVKYMLVAASMDIVSLKTRVYNNINTSNWNVRAAAQIAILTLDKNHSFNFLHRLHRPLSQWQQINLHHTLVRNSIPVPNFSEFILSQNNSVVVFALRMMEAFNQKEDGEKVIRLLTHKDEEIRHQALHTIKDLKISDATDILIQEFPKEKLHIQLDIIEALAKINNVQSNSFLKSLLPNKQFEINWAIIKNMPASSLKKVIENISLTSELQMMLNQIAYK